MPVVAIPPTLLRNILEDPHNDWHRLIYADYAEEHGDADYANFVRTQVQIATQYTVALQQREAALFKACKRHLALPAGLGAEVCVGHIQSGSHKPTALVYRGFVAEIHLTADDWLRHGVEVAKRQPVLSVRLRGKSPLRVVFDFQNQAYFAWTFSHNPIATHDLPVQWNPTPSITTWQTHSQQEAYDMLNRWAINWARRGSGLGEIEV